MEKRIIVIDDHYAIRKSFTLTLAQSKYEVDTAFSGENAIEMFEKNKYQLVFLDLKMPGLNGVETLKKIREIDPEVTVYIITAFHQEFLDDLCSLKKDKIDFELLQKPIDDEKIMMLTKSVLGDGLDNLSKSGNS